MVPLAERVNRAWQSLIAAATGLDRNFEDEPAARRYASEYARSLLEAARADELTPYEVEILRADAEACLDRNTPPQRIHARVARQLARYASFESLQPRVRRALADAAARLGRSA